MKQTASLHSQVYQGLAAVFLLLLIGSSGGESRAEAVAVPQTSSTAELSQAQNMPPAVLSSRANPAQAKIVATPAPITRLKPVTLPTPKAAPAEDSTSPPEDADPLAPDENRDPEPTPSPAISPAAASPSPLSDASHKPSAQDRAEIEALIKQIEFELNQLPPLPTPNPTKNPSPAL